MKIIYMGTPEFAVSPLEKIVGNGHEVVLCVTQPDKQKGRGKKIQFPPVKEAAISLGIPVLQPDKVKEPEFVSKLKEYAPDLIVVAAFGQILSKEILELPKYGCINIHASILPNYRGAAPIQWAVINGEAEAGVTTMQMDVGLDTGDILLCSKIPVEEKETYGSLQDKLSALGAELIIETLKALEDGNLTRKPQDEEASSYARMMSKEMGNLDFSRPASELERLIRGLNPWPSAYTHLHGKTLKVWSAKVVKENEVSGDVDLSKASFGEIVMVDKKGFAVKTGEDFLFFLEVQLEGKKRMDCGSFLRGYQVEIGEECC